MSEPQRTANGTLQPTAATDDGVSGALSIISVRERQEEMHSRSFFLAEFLACSLVILRAAQLVDGYLR